MSARTSRRRGLTILGVVMADLAFNLCLQALVDDFQEARQNHVELVRTRAELGQLQNELVQDDLEDSAGRGAPLEPPVAEIQIDLNRRVFLNATEVGLLVPPVETVVADLRSQIAALPQGPARLQLDRRLPVELYATVWPALAGRKLTLSLE